MTTTIQNEARNLLMALREPAVIAKLGKVECGIHAMMIVMSLNSSTPLEAEERLEKQVAELQRKLGSE